MRFSTQVAGLVGLLLVVACHGGRVAAQNDEPEFVITVTQAQEPEETAVGAELKLRFHVNVSNTKGKPARLTAPVDLMAELPNFTDEDTGLSMAAAEDLFHLPTGFAGGTRSLVTAATGAPPLRPVVLAAPVRFATEAADVGLKVPDEVLVQIRTQPAEADGEFKFCIAPGRGERGAWPLLYADFGSVLVIAGVTGAGLPTATVLAGLEFEVVEVVRDAETGEVREVRQDAVEISEDPHTRVIDSDGDGFAEGIHAVLRLRAAQPVAVKPNQRRRFILRARHTDGINVDELGEADFDIEPRERTGVGGVAVVGAGTGVATRFERRQSRAFGITPSILRNGAPLNAAAHATMTVVPDQLNASPVAESGLYDLGWSVRVDWARLQGLVNWQPDDTLTVTAELGGADNRASVTWEVAFDGINATVFDTPESLIEKEYDNGVTERDHVDALVEALKEAGLIARRTSKGDEVEIPDVLADPNDDGFPDWGRVRRALRAIKNAVKAYKTAPRVLDGVDCLEGRREWDVCVTIQCPLVDEDGEPVTDDDGNQVIKDVNLKIFFNPQRNGRDGRNASGSDDGAPCTLLIVIAQCGVSESGNAGNGGEAEADISGRGSVGIAVGGDGSGNRDDPDSNEAGGNGGKGIVKIGRKPGNADDGPGPTGVSIGGDGGDTVGTNARPGDGADAEADADQAACGSIVAGGGDSGHAEFPPSRGGHTSGTARVKNGDSVTSDGKRKAVNRKSRRVKGGGQRGRVTGGIARAEKDLTPDSTDGVPRPNPNPVTGDE